MIGVMATRQQDRLWTAKVWIGPTIETPKALRDVDELVGYESQQDAEYEGLKFGKRRLNLYALNKLPHPS